ncbi:Metallo-dependent hydrolase [Amylocystis lapponica]|nr:Metallo-dependent hydrolase [Amylocystis lapponica]
MTEHSYLLKGGIIATFVSGSDKPLVFQSDVLVEGSVIKQVADNITAGPCDTLEILNCTGKWIIPGMVDTHRHAFLTVARGVAGDWLLSEYLVKMSWCIQASLTPEEVRIGELAGCLDALYAGVTTILDHFHGAITPAHSDASLEAAIQSGARVVWCPARQSPPTKLFPAMEFGYEPDTSKWQLEKLKELGSKNGGKLTTDGRVTLGLAYDLVGMGPISTHQEILKLARAIPVAIVTAHVTHESRILTMRDADMLGPDVVFSHCNGLHSRTAPDDEAWAAMKQYDCAVAATPADELGMAMGNPTAFDAVQRGVKCGLGVDTLSINGGDFFSHMRTALQWQRGRFHEDIDRKGLPTPRYNQYNAADVFRLATLGGAEALNMGHLIGSIEVGKKADIAVFDTDSVNLAGIANPVLGITFHATSADVELVMVDGNIVKRDGKLTDVPWVAHELKRAAAGVDARWPPEKLDEVWMRYCDTFGIPSF